MSTYRYRPIPDLVRALADHSVSAVDLAEEALDLLLGVGAMHRAVAAGTAARARMEAGAIDQAREAGRELGPLAGIPYGVKDIIAASGAPTSWGVPTFVDRIIPEDATSVGRLSGAGAVLVGKLTTTSLAGGGGHRIAGISAHGQPRNPWDPERFAGSSSSGSAIAVALGIVPFALGTETGGSIMQPAAFCGVTGYRPTFGRIPRTGALSLSPTLDKIGVLARTAADCELVADVLGGPDGVDIHALEQLAPDAGAVDWSTLRVGLSERDLDGVDQPMVGALSRGLSEMEALTSRFRSAEVDSTVPYGDAIELMIRVDTATGLRSHLLDPEFQLADDFQLERLRQGLDVPAPDYALARHVADQARAEFARLFSEVDVLVATTFPTQPQRLSDPRPPRGSRTVAERLLPAVNMAGLPGVSVPCGLDDDGFPVALHLIGPVGSDRLLLRLATAYQAVTDHHVLRPPDLRAGDFQP